MKILIICGSYPPDSCGVGDYAFKLESELEKQDIDIMSIANIDWSFSKIRKIIGIIKKFSPDIIHIQYPSNGFKYSIVPQLLALIYKNKTVVTIHEVSQANIIRKLSLLPFCLVKILIFTSKYEEKYFFSYSPIKTQSRIIPIASNIDQSNVMEYQNRDLNKIIYFGQLRPYKGIEEVIKLARLIKQKKIGYEVIIIGQVVDKFYDYYKKNKNESKELPIHWLVNRDQFKVSELLSSSLFCFLPFPDGASERRGSLLAALSHKMLIFTTKGKYTPVDMEGVVNFVKSESEVLDNIEEISNSFRIDKLLNLEYKIESFMKKYSWDAVVNKHIELYEYIIEKR